jgi:hypothetical protein
MKCCEQAERTPREQSLPPEYFHIATDDQNRMTLQEIFPGQFQSLSILLGIEVELCCI